MPVCPAILSSIPWSRAYVREELRKADLSQEVRTDVVLAVSEAVTNAVCHSGSDVVELEVIIRPEEVEVVVRDRGVFHWPSTSRDQVQPRDGGYGLPILHSVMDEVRLTLGTPEQPGTIVELHRRMA